MSKVEYFEKLAQGRESNSHEAKYQQLFDSDKHGATKDFIRSVSGSGSMNTINRVHEIVGDGVEMEREVKHAIAFPTGVLSLDYQLGGGIPAGVTEIYGEPSSGKTSVAWILAAAAQKSGKTVLLLSPEYYNPMRAKASGVDMDSLLLVKDDYSEKSLEVILDAYQNIHNLVVIIDSITMIRPSEKGVWQERWYDMVKSFTERALTSMSFGSALILLSQVRQGKSLRGGLRKQYQSSAKELAPLVSLQAKLTRHAVTTEGYELAVKIERNTVRKPHSIVILPFSKNLGVDVALDTLRVAVELGVVEKRGSHYYYEDDKLGQGEKEASGSLNDWQVKLKIDGQCIAKLTGA